MNFVYFGDGEDIRNFLVTHFPGGNFDFKMEYNQTGEDRIAFITCRDDLLIDELRKKFAIEEVTQETQMPSAARGNWATIKGKLY